MDVFFHSTIRGFDVCKNFKSNIIEHNKNIIKIEFSVKNLTFPLGIKLRKMATIEFKDSSNKEIHDILLQDIDTEEIVDTYQLKSGSYNFEGFVQVNKKDLPKDKNIKDVESIQIYL